MHIDKCEFNRAIIFSMHVNGAFESIQCTYNLCPMGNYGEWYDIVSIP